MTEKIYLETFEKCPGSVCFPLLNAVLIILLEFNAKKSIPFGTSNLLRKVTLSM